MKNDLPNALKHILIVDDDPDLRSLMVDYLRNNGYEISAASDGNEMRVVLAEQTIDLLILDLMLPGEDGLSLLRWIREQNGPPIIIVSARGDETDRIVGLEMGADDYLAKPFSPRELLARVGAVLRRSRGNEPTPQPDASTLGFGPFRLHLDNHTLTNGTEEVPLTAGEYNLLRVFLEYPNKVLSRDHLISLLKGYERSPYDRSIDIRVTRLRRKIEPQAEKPTYLRTIWGEGYLFATGAKEAE
ncbi:MAG: response regulator [Methylococcaceae bacterium]|nr:response regulator [Methylococcaceae bacterium]